MTLPLENEGTAANAWTQVRVDLLIEMHDHRVPRSTIANTINKLTGSNFSKAAVCGKIDRIFPSAKPTKTDEEKAAIRERRRLCEIERKRRKRQELGARQTIKLVVKNDPPSFQCAEVDSLNLTIEEIGPNQCRYLAGNGAPWLYCGRREFRRSYCAFHFDIVYQPPQPVRRAA